MTYSDQPTHHEKEQPVTTYQQLTLIPTTKTCTRCNETKPTDQFYKDKSAKDGLRSACKECTSSASRAYHKANRERQRENARAWNAANPERQREYARAWYEANRERALETARAWNAANRERHREHTRAWAAANLDKRSASQHRRRAKKACAVPQRWIVDHNHGDPHACWWCGQELVGVTTHTDHVMPIKLGGPAHPDNEVTTCQTCNLRKQDKHPLVWIAELTSNQ